MQHFGHPGWCCCALLTPHTVHRTTTALLGFYQPKPRSALGSSVSLSPLAVSVLWFWCSWMGVHRDLGHKKGSGTLCRLLSCWGEHGAGSIFWWQQQQKWLRRKYFLYFHFRNEKGGEKEWKKRGKGEKRESKHSENKYLIKKEFELNQKIFWANLSFFWAETSKTKRALKRYFKGKITHFLFKLLKTFFSFEKKKKM